ncbi:hypothetical protein [Exiguobacterium aestuarii]|uniref:hypothetical protein n=1 Tax=Exiguobacterium aestuarii TaxID=273527 RepID=UPI001CD23F72|nr:hypothetical protein [Exiguobacterium aestuarii]MCA0980203.1 hypothetical protein [Exiguobacterium aestuarii]
MLTERQTDILFETTGYAALASLLLTMLLGQYDYYLIGAAVTLTLATVFAGISYLSTKGEDA